MQKETLKFLDPDNHSFEEHDRLLTEESNCDVDYLAKHRSRINGKSFSRASTSSQRSIASSLIPDAEDY